MRSVKLLKNLGFLVIFIGVIAMYLPSEFRVERSLLIEAQPKDVYAVLVDLKKWEQWGTWFQDDPNLAVAYEGPDRAIGMRAAWNGDVLGAGSIEIVSLKHKRQLAYTLDHHFHSVHSDGEFQIESTAMGSRLTWVSHGDVGYNLLQRFLLIGYGKELIEHIDIGLENIKTMVENNPIQVAVSRR